MLSLIFAVLCAAKALDLIADCGAIPKTDLEASLDEAFQNSFAMTDCIYMANRSESDRTVILPTNTIVTMMNIAITNITNVEIQIDGTLEMAKYY